MTRSGMGFARHLSIVWGVTLAVITLVEWNSLDRDPMRKEILSPFIARDVSVSVVDQLPDNELERDELPLADVDAPQQLPLRYEVEFSFNGPLFLVAFFLPVLLFHGVARLLAAVRRPKPPVD